VSEAAARRPGKREGHLLLTLVRSRHLFTSIQRLKGAAAILMRKKATNKSAKKTKKQQELIAQRPRTRRLHLSSQRSCNESWRKNL
jgi:hypothetical protein